VLGISTVIWSFTIARLQQGNADQLADGFLFVNATTFHQAQFPATHTQLLKWPLFWLLAALHSAPDAYIVCTMALCLATVGALAYILFRIVREPLKLGTLYLGLACVLVLVPAQILADTPSPLNAAMVAGRNIEYPLYIAALALLLPRGHKPDWLRSGAAALLLGLLFASDQLFLVCSVGGAVGLLLYTYGWRRRSLVTLGWLWLAVSGLGWMLSRLLQWALGHITAIVASNTDSYGHIATISGTHGAVAYSVQGLLLNFGVSLSSGRLDILPALLNVLLLAAIIYAAYRIIHRTTQESASLDRATTVSLLLGMSTLAAFIAYILTNHLFPADARYLSIVLFAGFVTLATYIRTIHIRPKLLYGCVGVATVGVAFGLVALVRHTNQVIATDPLRARDERVVQALASHHEQILVGDFWRVLPIKEETAQAHQSILPLTGCLQPRQLLASGAWRENLYIHSFAYLLPVQQFGTPFGRCSIQTIDLAYGRPTSIERIAGTRRNPSELILFYNDGAARLRGNTNAPPIPVFGVPTEGTARPAGSTIVPLADPS
jgi:hypothetical protein